MSIASTCFENPRFFAGPIPELSLVAAKDGQTWNPGQFVRRTGSGLVLCKTQATQISGITAQSQPVATSSSTVPVYMIPGASTKLVIYASTGNANDTKAIKTLIGKNRGLNVNTSICTLSEGCDTAAKAAFNIVDIYANKDKFKTDTGTTPGQFIVTVQGSFLTAQGL